MSSLTTQPAASDVGPETASARGPAERRAPLRVAFCIDNMNVGGTELNALRTARHLLERGVDLSVFCLSQHGPLLERYAELHVPVDLLPLSKLYGWNAIKCGRRMTRIIRERGVNIVHAHDFYSNIFAAPWARASGAAFIASRRWWEGPDRRTQRWANRAAYVFANRVLANSASVAKLLVRGEHVPKSRVVVVQNFLDEEAFDAPPSGWTEALAAELNLPAERVVVGVVASLSPIKDHATLFRAMSRLTQEWPRLYLILVGGDGGSRPALERLAADLGIADKVRFAGLRPNQPSPHYLFDIAVLSSVSEGFPNSILEAMAAGRPVVATAVGAIPDAVREGENGFLIKPGDSTELQARLRLLLQDRALARRLGDRGRQLARGEYSAKIAIDGLVSLYRGSVKMASRDSRT